MFINEHVEIVAVKLTMHTGYNVFICCLYISSNAPDAVYSNYIQALEVFFDSVKTNLDDVIIVMGDFNLPLINWVEEAGSIFLPVSDLSGISSGVIWYHTQLRHVAVEWYSQLTESITYST